MTANNSDKKTFTSILACAVAWQTSGGRTCLDKSAHQHAVDSIEPKFGIPRIFFNYDMVPRK